MGVEEEAVASRKGKKSKREKRNEEGVKEISRSGNVVVEADERIFEKEDVIKKNNFDKDDVTETNNVDKGDTKKKMKMKKKKKVNIDTEDGDIKGDTRIIEKEDVMEKSNDDKDDAMETYNVDKGDKEKKIRRKKKKVNTVTGYSDIEGKKGIEDGRILSWDVDGEVKENVDQMRKKKEKGRRKGDLAVGSDCLVENEGDVRLVYNEMRDSDGKNEKEGKVKTEKNGEKKKKKKKREKKTDKGDVSAAQRDSGRGKAVDTERKSGKGVEISGEGCDRKFMEKVEKKKMKRVKRQTEDDLKGVEIIGEGCDGEVMEKVERKRWKREKGKSMDDLGVGGQDISVNSLASPEGNPCSTENKIQDGDVKSNIKGKRKKANQANNGSDNPMAKKGNKKVRFSGQVEVFPLSADSNSHQSKDGDDKLVRGKRFSQEEDEIIKAAVYKYIEKHALGEEGLNMVLNCSSHPEVKGCWKHIAKAISYRPQISIYDRAQKIFQRGDKRKWTEEDYELLKKLQGEHGNQWKLLAEELGRYRTHVRSTWGRIKLLNRKRGRWSQEEYQSLFDLVNTDLRLKLSGEKKTKHGMLRDDIHWSAISDSLSTRCNAVCCMKWYRQLASPMVAEGLWADADDYRLISTLFSLDASCMEDVDWDNLLDHRSGDVCRKRWNQMVLHIGQHGSKSFAEQVEILSRRYCPDLLEVREAWDSKPVVA